MGRISVKPPAARERTKTAYTLPLISGCGPHPAGVLRPALGRPPERTPDGPLAPPPPRARGVRLPGGIPGLPPPLRPRDLVLRPPPRPGRPRPPGLRRPRDLGPP